MINLSSHRVATCRIRYGSLHGAGAGALEGTDEGAGRVGNKRGSAPSDKENKPAMAATLHEMLLAPEIQPQVVVDCEALVNAEVSNMSGISGMAVKLAYKTVRTFDAGHIRYMIQ